MENKHPASEVAQGQASKKEDYGVKLANQQLQYGAEKTEGGMEHGSDPQHEPEQGSLQNFALKPAERMLSAQANWYVYSNMKISKSEFEGEPFKNMLREMFTAGGSTGDPGSCPILSVKDLELYLAAEFAVFEKFLAHMLDLMVVKHKGVPFAQAIHDGGTPKNHIKCQAVGLQFVDPKWRYVFGCFLFYFAFCRNSILYSSHIIYVAICCCLIVYSRLRVSYTSTGATMSFAQPSLPPPRTQTTWSRG